MVKDINYSFEISDTYKDSLLSDNKIKFYDPELIDFCRDKVLKNIKYLVDRISPTFVSEYNNLVNRYRSVSGNEVSEKYMFRKSSKLLFNDLDYQSKYLSFYDLVEDIGLELDRIKNDSYSALYIKMKKRLYIAGRNKNYNINKKGGIGANQIITDDDQRIMTKPIWFDDISEADQIRISYRADDSVRIVKHIVSDVDILMTMDEINEMYRLFPPNLIVRNKGVKDNELGTHHAIWLLKKSIPCIINYDNTNYPKKITEKHIEKIIYKYKKDSKEFKNIVRVKNKQRYDVIRKKLIENFRCDKNYNNILCKNPFNEKKYDIYVNDNLDLYSFTEVYNKIRSIIQKKKYKIKEKLSKKDILEIKNNKDVYEKKVRINNNSRFFVSESIYNELINVDKGNRNTVLNKTGFTAINYNYAIGHTDERVLKVLINELNDLMKYPLSEKEVNSIFKSIMKSIKKFEIKSKKKIRKGIKWLKIEDAIKLNDEEYNYLLSLKYEEIKNNKKAIDILTHYDCKVLPKEYLINKKNMYRKNVTNYAVNFSMITRRKKVIRNYEALVSIIYKYNLQQWASYKKYGTHKGTEVTNFLIEMLYKEYGIDLSIRSMRLYRDNIRKSGAYDPKTNTIDLMKVNHYVECLEDIDKREENKRNTDIRKFGYEGSKNNIIDACLGAVDESDSEEEVAEKVISVVETVSTITKYQKTVVTYIAYQLEKVMNFTINENDKFNVFVNISDKILCLVRSLFKVYDKLDMMVENPPKMKLLFG